MKNITKSIIVLFGLTFMTGCNSVFVGDSIMNMSRPNVAAHFPNSKVNAADGRGAYNGGVNGQPGTGMEAIAAEVASVDPGKWMIIELGSNNISFDAGQRAWFIVSALSTVPNDRCVAWVAPFVAFNQVQVDAWAASLLQYVILANQPCSTVVRWDLMAAAHPEYMADFTHPNEIGKEALVCLIGSSIGSPC